MKEKWKTNEKEKKMGLKGVYINGPNTLSFRSNAHKYKTPQSPFQFSPFHPLPFILLAETPMEPRKRF